MADHLDCCPTLGRFPHSRWLLPVPPICTPFPLHLTTHHLSSTAGWLKHCFSPSERLQFCTERPLCGSLLTTSRTVTWLPSSSVLVLSHLSFGSVRLLADKPQNSGGHRSFMLYKPNNNQKPGTPQRTHLSTHRRTLWHQIKSTSVANSYLLVYDAV